MLSGEGDHMRTDKEYKDLTIKEFTKAASVYESGNSGIYEICKEIQASSRSEKVNCTETEI